MDNLPHLVHVLSAECVRLLILLLRVLDDVSWDVREETIRERFKLTHSRSLTGPRSAEDERQKSALHVFVSSGTSRQSLVSPP